MTAESATAPAKSLPARVVGVLFAPRATYADVAAHPRMARHLPRRVPDLAPRRRSRCSRPTSASNAVLDQQVAATRVVRPSHDAGADRPDGGSLRRTSRYIAPVFQAASACRSRRWSSPASRSRSSTRCSAATRRSSRSSPSSCTRASCSRRCRSSPLPLAYAREIAVEPDEPGGVPAVPRRELVPGAAARVDRSVLHLVDA